MDDDIDPFLDDLKILQDKVEQADQDIIEAQEIKFNNLIGEVSDELNSSKMRLVYSRELSFKQIQVNGIPIAVGGSKHRHLVRVNIY
jgi:predicted transcriptional regulator